MEIINPLEYFIESVRIFEQSSAYNTNEQSFQLSKGPVSLDNRGTLCNCYTSTGCVAAI